MDYTPIIPGCKAIILYSPDSSVIGNEVTVLRQAESDESFYTNDFHTGEKLKIIMQEELGPHWLINKSILAKSSSINIRIFLSEYIRDRYLMRSDGFDEKQLNKKRELIHE